VQKYLESTRVRLIHLMWPSRGQPQNHVFITCSASPACWSHTPTSQYQHNIIRDYVSYLSWTRRVSHSMLKFWHLTYVRL